RGLLENDGCRRVSVDVRVDVEEFRAEFDGLVLFLAECLIPVSVFCMRRRFLAVATARGFAPPVFWLIFGWNADVFEPQNFAVRIGLQNDISVLLRLGKAPDVGEDVFFRLRGHAGGLAEASG